MTDKPQASAADTPPMVPGIRPDVISGLLVFLIALPLCLGISNASGFPAINGVFTAIAGGILCAFLSNSALTIKGPAAGMIAIVLGAVSDFASAAGVTKDTMSNADPAIYLKYLPAVCGVAVIAGIIQIIGGLLKAGSLADLFPTSVIHGLLASIGLIIIGKQIYLLLGLKPNGSTEAYEAYLEMPAHIPHLAWQAALIGIASLVLLFLYPILKKRLAICRIVPAQLIILAVAIPAAAVLYKDFEGAQRSYTISHHGEEVKQPVKALLVKVPPSASALPASFIFPSFEAIGTFRFWNWVLMFTLVGSLESLLSAKAVDVLDPWKRKSDLNRDLLAVGVANTAVACIGGLPMISEIVRSSANKDYGAQSTWANFFHGLFLLVAILALPVLLNMIPLTALAAMLVYAGCRLANYKEFLHMYHIGKEQLVIFLATIAGVLAIDLLWGVAIGIAVKIAIELMMGVRPAHFVTLPMQVHEQGVDCIYSLHGSLIFTNWLKLKKQIMASPDQTNIVLDMRDVHFIDHTVMSRLDDLKNEFKAKGRQLTLQNMENHRALSHDSLAAQKRMKVAPD